MFSDCRLWNMFSDCRLWNMFSDCRMWNMFSDCRLWNMFIDCRLCGICLVTAGCGICLVTADCVEYIFMIRELYESTYRISPSDSDCPVSMAAWRSGFVHSRVSLTGVQHLISASPICNRAVC